MSLEPAAAALAAIVVLDELLSPIQWLAVVCVVVASIGATRADRCSASPRRTDPGPAARWRQTLRMEKTTPVTTDIRVRFVHALSDDGTRWS